MELIKAVRVFFRSFFSFVFFGSKQCAKYEMCEADWFRLVPIVIGIVSVSVARIARHICHTSIHPPQSPTPAEQYHGLDPIHTLSFVCSPHKFISYCLRSHKWARNGFRTLTHQIYTIQIHAHSPVISRIFVQLIQVNFVNSFVRFFFLFFPFSVLIYSIG